MGGQGAEEEGRMGDGGKLKDSLWGGDQKGGWRARGRNVQGED